MQGVSEALEKFLGLTDNINDTIRKPDWKSTYSVKMADDLTVWST